MLSKEASAIPALFGDIVGQLGHLVHTEVRLAQAELSEKIDVASTGAVYVAVAGMLMIPAIVMALFGLAVWLSQIGVPVALSYVIAAVLSGSVSAICLASGLSRLKLKRLRLSNTMHQINQDVVTARNLTK